MRLRMGIVTLVLTLLGCSDRKPAPVALPAAPVETPAVTQVMTAARGEEWSIVRVGGDMTAQAERVDESWQFGKMKIDTPLPVGYPAPTPPGAIELKKYPEVRRAQVSRQGLPDTGMSMAFFPLFQHIQRRKIAMTSPVEMDYSGINATGPDAPERDYESTSGKWVMSFLYRTPDIGPLGGDKGGIEVVDVAPMTVLSIGFRGAYGVERVEEGLYALEQWLAKQNEWERVGEPRALYYNGPERRGGLKWGEVQLRVKRVQGVSS